MWVSIGSRERLYLVYGFVIVQGKGAEFYFSGHSGGDARVYVSRSILIFDVPPAEPPPPPPPRLGRPMRSWCSNVIHIASTFHATTDFTIIPVLTCSGLKLFICDKANPESYSQLTPEPNMEVV